ncbi:hypothetical protein Tco_0126768 [Tanacetum coccineum]
MHLDCLLWIVLSIEDKLNYLEQPLPPAPVALEEIQQNLENLYANYMLKELKTLFAQQNYNMHSLGKTVNELHAMLKLHEQILPKNNAPALHDIRAGHWKRNCPQYLAELLKKKKNTASGAGGSGSRASRKLKPGALSLYMGNGQREAIKAIGVLSFGLLDVLCEFYVQYDTLSRLIKTSYSLSFENQIMLPLHFTYASANWSFSCALCLDYDDVTPSDTYSVQAPSGGVTDWYQSQGYREPGRISRFSLRLSFLEAIEQVSYLKLFDVLKQFQNEVNDIRSERISQKHKGKEIAKPVTPQSESVSEEDSDPEQARRDKDMQKNWHLAQYFKKPYNPTNKQLRTFFKLPGNKTEIYQQGITKTISRNSLGNQGTMKVDGVGNSRSRSWKQNGDTVL